MWHSICLSGSRNWSKRAITMTPKKLSLATAIFCAAVFLSATGAHAVAVITDPGNAFAVGIGTSGELYDTGSGIGFSRLADGYDPLAPGTPRDSWGLSIG